ncbi:RNA polymerase sigma factor [Cellulomonas uda]|uniref:RNA polymerase subunit sigma-24 n=1 Tax=Cellulomonas uda TaxID=1714 RepID=A0A4Y3KBI9_CELUD|nr:sigma-70 family RNA polymerase sigma factor [Cellulomonas uda]NII67916.1 RNA polymerase sigma factor (sigma-70 family) [Cellulomonas uda]GEA80375.1 RNA polymerase subunit sigma-24 [Cellulomonas uda]
MDSDALTRPPVAPVHDEVARFLAEHRRALVRVALGLTREPAGAEDLVQDTAVRLLRHWDKVRTARSPFAYARTMLVRLYLDQVRGTEVEVVGARRREPVAPDEIAHLESVDAAVSMIAGLPPRARAVLTLRYVEDLDDRAIAEVLGITRSTVRVTAHHALRRLSVTETARRGRQDRPGPREPR